VSRYPRMALRLITTPVAASDRAVLARPDVRAMSLESMGEAFRRGTWGVIGDIAVLARPWGFPLAGLRPPVYLWHGARDRNVPIRAGRYLAHAIPAREATFFPDEGHELLFDHWHEILSALAAHA
jgi:pimeloyl-ACP methyl ester carboxylesterase